MFRFWIIAVTLALFGCQNQPPAPPAGVLGLEGFEAFPTPRSFDGPGTVFRINGEGKRFTVSEIKFKIRGGEEELPKYSSTRELSLTQFLEALGASAAAMPASVRANLSNTRNTKIESTTGRRYFVIDDDIEPKMLDWAARTKPKPDSVYYLIRETVATQSLVYKVEKSWLASLNIDVQLLKTAGYKGEAKDVGNDTVDMDRKFENERYVWFKAEKIIVKPALGAGPGQYRIQREPIQGSVIGF